MTGPTAAEVRALVDLSDERDRWEALCAERERAAFERGRAMGDREGYERACADMEAEWHAVAVPASRRGDPHADLESRRWGPDGPAHFGDPKPSDLTGQQARTRARESWEPLGLPLPGMVFLGGPPVHGGHWCTCTCRAYRPGWYPTEQAAEIIATLPAPGSNPPTDRSRARLRVVGGKAKGAA